MLTMIRASLALAIFLFFPGAAPADAQERTLTMDDRSAVSWPSSARISPDGTRITYLLDDRLYLRSLGFDEPKILVDADIGAWGNRWSADGEWIYYLAEGEDGSQVLKQHLEDATQSIQVTSFKHGVYGVNFSPDESQILLRASDNDLLTPNEDAAPQPIVITGRNYKTDSGDGYVREGDTQYVYLYDIESETMRRIASGPHAESGASWSPDGKSIVFVKDAGADESYQSDLWIVASKADANSEPRRLSNSLRAKRSPAYRPDGKQIAYFSAENGQYPVRHIAVVPAQGGEPRILTGALDRWVSSFAWSADGEWIYFVYLDSGAQSLARVRISDSRIEPIIDGDQVIWSFDLAPTGDIALVSSTGNAASNIYRYSEGKATQLTDANRAFYDDVALGRKIKRTLVHGGGIEIDAFITTPPSYSAEKTYPTILNLHGGPHDQWAWGFSFTSQYFASLGYVVVEPNPRGSAGKGRAFVDPMIGSWGDKDFDDVMAVADYVIDEGFSDSKNLFVTGYSYGGMLTNAVITQTDRFNAAASGAGHSFMAANVGHDIHEKWWLWELGPPLENRESYNRLSPLLRAESVVTPTLFLAGQLDFNVPVINSELFYHALKVFGVDTKLVVYPGMYHGGWSDEFEKDYLIQIADWFETYRN